MSVPVPPVITRFEEGDDHVIADESQLPFAHIKILGSGHSGVVEKVVDVTTGTEFARKKMAIRSKSARAEMERIFRNEISIIRGLQRHHHIIRVFASYMAKREIGLILEPVADEGDLNRFLEHVEEVREANIFDPRLARLLPIIDRAFGCLASGLAFMHKKRIRHKDIKPQNVLIYRGSVLYTDFGYSLNTNQFSHSTTEGQPDSLTRRYAAPEVLANGERNSSSDTFSLGCVYLELLSAISDNPDLTPNMETFSRDLDKIQRCLLSAQLPQRLAFLRSIIMLMTTRDRQSRPKARQVSKEIMRYNELCCPACRTLDETETDTDTSTELLIVTSVSLPESKVTKTVRPPPANTFDASPKSQSPAQSGNPNLSRLSSAFKDAVPVPEWSAEHQRYLISVWHYQDQKYCRRHYVEGQGWILFDWNAQNRNTAQISIEPQIRPGGLYAAGQGGWLSRRSGTTIPQDLDFAQHRESLDPSFCMRGRVFFKEGRVFSVLFNESVVEKSFKEWASAPPLTTKYNENIHTHVRRFIVVRQRKEFCYAVPIFTYSGKATTKPGVKADEHAIAYSHGNFPRLVSGEKVLTKAAICVVMEAGVAPLDIASRIYFGIHHPIQYNIKVKDLGCVHPAWLHILLGDWSSMDDIETMQSAQITAEAQGDGSDEP